MKKSETLVTDEETGAASVTVFSLNYKIDRWWRKNLFFNFSFYIGV